MEMTDDVKEFINIARYVDYDDGAGQGLRQNEAGWMQKKDNSQTGATNEGNILTVRTIIL